MILDNSGFFVSDSFIHGYTQNLWKKHDCFLVYNVLSCYNKRGGNSPRALNVLLRALPILRRFAVYVILLFEQ